jgi:hypothetical protein
VRTLVRSMDGLINAKRSSQRCNSTETDRSARIRDQSPIVYIALD